MRKKFREIKLSQANKNRLDQINEIIEEYRQQNYVLTLRQLYYQLVSRDVIPNHVKEYAKLSSLLKEGRMGGVVDWSAIEDRLRVPFTPASWDSPAEILETATNQYKKPRMKGQENYLEVWVEKDALSGVLKRVTSQYHVPILVNRGYSSASAMYDSYKRFKDAFDIGQSVTILYLGDFDPSGMDMIRDIYARSLEFLYGDYSIMSHMEDLYNDLDEDAREDIDRDYYDDELAQDDGEYQTSRGYLMSKIKVVPIALTRAQITRYKPPPNPAKKTDPRSKKFIAEHGASSWEVDALKPEILNALLTDAIEERIDLTMYNKIIKEEESDKKKLQKVIKDFKK